ncbi:MAG: phosphoribosyltransferase family protein [Anaerosomatales bacterium]|nr:phosphoribosyltransferase family protein [Anaerosomatales bacterium]
MYRDRAQAGQELAEALRERFADSGAVVLGLPRGGVVVAAEVARGLRLPLDIIVTSKLGAPGNPEFAVGAVDAEGTVMLNPSVSVPESYVDEEAGRKAAEVRRRITAYRGDRPAPDLAGRTVLVVDDGLATGSTMRAAIASVRARGGHPVVAVPVTPPDTATRLRADGVEVIALREPWDFYAVGQFYHDFGQTTDAEVMELLAEAWSRETEGE